MFHNFQIYFLTACVWYREQHFVVFSSDPRAPALRAHLLQQQVLLIFWILQMKSKGTDRDKSPVVFEIPSEQEWPSILKGGKKGLIFVPSLLLQITYLFISSSVSLGVKEKWPRIFLNSFQKKKKKAQCQDNKACGWLWWLNCLALWQSQAREELWPSSAPLIKNHSETKPEPELWSTFMFHPGETWRKPHFSLFIVALLE